MPWLKARFVKKSDIEVGRTGFPVGVNAVVVCRARHMFLKVSQSYHVVVTLASLRPSQMEAKGVAVLQRGIGDGASEGSSSVEAGYRESTR